MTQLRTIDFMNHLCDQHPLGGGLWICSLNELQKSFKIGVGSGNDQFAFYSEFYRALKLRPENGKLSVQGNQLLFNDQVVRKITDFQAWKDFCVREIRDNCVSFQIRDLQNGTLLEFDKVVMAARFLKSLLHVLIDCDSTNKGIGFLNRFKMEEVIEPFRRMLTWDEVDFVSIAKFITCWPLPASRYVDDDQELPPVPILFNGETYSDSPVLWRGRIKKFILNRIKCRAKGTKNLKFLYSWQQAKRGCETVSSGFESLAVKKHQKSLSTPFDPVSLNSDLLLYKLVEDWDCDGMGNCELVGWREKKVIGDDAHDLARAIVDLIIPYKSDTFQIKKLEGSQSACKELVRSAGGQRGVIRRIIGYSPHYDYLEAMFYCPREGVVVLRTDLYGGWGDALEMVRCANRHSVYGAHREKRIKEVYDHLFEGEWSYENQMQADLLAWVDGCVEEWEDDEDLIESCENFYTTPWLNPQCSPEPAVAEVATVKEPLKVRVLTKEEAVPQYLCRSVQKELWQNLRLLKPFRLIGEPVSEAIISDVLTTGAPFEMAVSGDYSAATDGLNPELSEIILERCLRNLRVPDDIRDSARAILGMHLLTYGERLSKMTGLEPFMQVRGQLMGGILSFPILCILNLLTFLVSVDSGRNFVGNLMSDWSFISKEAMDGKWVKRNRRGLNQLKVLINGDDILFPAGKHEYTRWSENLKHFGFTKSLGKNLISKRFCTVNSEIFAIREPTTLRTRVNCSELEPKEVLVPYEVEKIGYLNLGLLESRSKVNQKGADGSPLWDLYNKMIEGSDNKNIARKYFLTYNRKEIQDMTVKGRFNLFMPRSLGGCGFIGEAEFYTDFQIRLASHLYRYNKKATDMSVKDLGLVNETVKTCSIKLNTQKGLLGKRVRKFDVPEKGWVVPSAEVTASAVFGGCEVENEMKRRVPYDILKSELHMKPVSLKKLLSFTDDLKIVLKAPFVPSEEINYFQERRDNRLRKEKEEREEENIITEMMNILL